MSFSRDAAKFAHLIFDLALATEFHDRREPCCRCARAHHAAARLAASSIIAAGVAAAADLAAPAPSSERRRARRRGRAAGGGARAARAASAAAAARAAEAEAAAAELLAPPVAEFAAAAPAPAAGAGAAAQPACATNFDGSPRNSPVAPDADGSLLSAAAGDSLLGDIARFRKAEAADPERAAAAAADESSLLKKTIGTLGTILTYNFFIIIGFFTWFMTGVVAQFGFQQTALIDAFRGAWDYVIQPLLGTHMTLTFLSYGLEKVAAGDGEDEYTKYNR